MIKQKKQDIGNIQTKIIKFISIIFFIFIIFQILLRIFLVSDILAKSVSPTIVSLSSLIFMHLILGAIAFVNIIPSKNDKEYKILFEKFFPYLHNVFYLIGFICFAASCYSLYFQQINFQSNITYDNIDNIFNKYTVFIIIFFCIIYNLLMVPLFYTEYKKSYDEVNKENPYFEYALWIWNYCSSFLLISTIIFVTNYKLDFSEAEEKTLNILENTQRTVQGYGKNYTFYEVKIEPSVYSRDIISVPPMIHYSAKEGDKIKIKIKKGFYGVRYITNDMILIKAPDSKSE